jgi:hypothetical protein
MRDNTQTVTVKKDELLARLQAGKTEHSAKVVRSQEVYRSRIVAELDARLKDARGGKNIDPGFLHLLPVPRDFTAEYDRAIARYTWEVADQVQLSEQDFNRYVLDEWEWQNQFFASTSAYLAE